MPDVNSWPLLSFRDDSWLTCGMPTGIRAAPAASVYQNRSAECPALKNVRSKKGGSGGLRPPDVDTILQRYCMPFTRSASCFCRDIACRFLSLVSATLVILCFSGDSFVSFCCTF